MTKTPAWQAWEQEIQSKLGLDPTICSGNKWNDIGDATDNNSPRDDHFRLLVDCKHTGRLSYPLKRIDLESWFEKGLEKGKRALVALRLWPKGLLEPMDVVVLALDDFVELLEKSRTLDEASPAADNSVFRSGGQANTYGALFCPAGCDCSCCYGYQDRDCHCFKYPCNCGGGPRDHGFLAN